MQGDRGEDDAVAGRGEAISRGAFHDERLGETHGCKQKLPA